MALSDNVCQHVARLWPGASVRGPQVESTGFLCAWAWLPDLWVRVVRARLLLARASMHVSFAKMHVVRAWLLLIGTCLLVVCTAGLDAVCPTMSKSASS